MVRVQENAHGSDDISLHGVKSRSGVGSNDGAVLFNEVESNI